MASERETRARDYHREVDDGSTWDLLSEEQRDCYRQAADRLFAAWAPKTPDRPPPGLLMSMAMRSDHAIGHAGFYDRKPAGIGKPGSDPGGHARRLAGTMSSMSQLWEEAVGCGFYAPHKEADYVALAETCGVTFTESGYPILTLAAPLPDSDTGGKGA